MCDENHIDFKLDFVSNGTLLTENIIKDIAELSDCASFQIAFDGAREVHNATKFYANKIGTYFDVLRNINNGLAAGMNFNIRCNYTSDNIDSFRYLVEDLRSLDHFDAEKIRISLQKVWQAKSEKSLDNKVSELRRMIDNDNVEVASENSSVPSHCYASAKNCIVINYDGNVFKCTAREFTNNNRIGRLNSCGKVELDEMYQDILELRFIDECKECKLLPICTICHQQHLEHKGTCPKRMNESQQNAQINGYCFKKCV